MTFVSCSVSERFVNPLFEVFDGGDFILSSYRDIEEDFTRMRIYFEDAAATAAATKCLRAALDIVGVDAPIETGEIPDEDWKFAYRRHFKTEAIGKRFLIVPEWELDAVRASIEQADNPNSRAIVHLDPGMAFGTGKHETTRACLEYIDELSPSESFLDMGCGSGILSIAAAKLGSRCVKGFDVDQEAVDASIENAALNGVEVEYVRFALGRCPGAVPQPPPFAAAPAGSTYDLVAANILGPLLIRFADEIVRFVGRRIVISGILTELYPEVLAAYAARGLCEVSRKTIGEWTTGLLARRTDGVSAP